MKKFAVMMLAGLAVLALGAQDLDVNGAFKISKPGAKNPDGWLWNSGPKPVGTWELVQLDGRNAVKLVGQKSMLSMVFMKHIPVKAGEKYELAVTATGTTSGIGYANVGAHLWGAKGKYLKGDYADGVKLTGKTVVIRRVIAIPETVNGQPPESIRVLFLLWSPGEAVFSNFSAKKLD